MYLDLYIPFQNHGFAGGPATFMRNLETYFERRNVHCTSDVHKTRNIFFPIRFDFKELCRIHGAGGRIIQRLDGIWLPGQNNSRHNRAIGEIYRHLADLVIFQSEYSKKQCSLVFGALPEGAFRTIINGVDKSIFYPAGLPRKIDSDSTLRLITTGNFRNRPMIELVVSALDELQNSFPFELDVVGPCQDRQLETFFDRDYLRYHGEKSLIEVAELLRSADIFVYSLLNPPCPNSVIEAVSCGLPVVGFDSGAMAELLPFARDLLAPVSDAVFQSYNDFKPAALAEKIAYAQANFETVRQRALKHNHLYSIESCGDAYLAAFEATLALPRQRNGKGHLQNLVDSRIWRFGKSLAERCSMDVAARSVCANELSSWDSDRLSDYLARICRQRAEGLPPSEALRFLTLCRQEINRLEKIQQKRQSDYGAGAV